MAPLTSSLAYSTDSAGMHPSHTLPLKLRAIAEAGFPAAELGFPDLEAYTEQEHRGYKKLDESGKGDLDTLVQAATNIRKLCSELGLSILAVHPFDHFEGYGESSKRAAKLERASAWFKVLQALGCEMLQVGSTPDESSSSDYDVIAGDLRKLADEAAAQDPPIRIAYELWAWGAYVNTWEHIWEICKRIDRPNFGLCLDTFQICARAYADPTSRNGLLQDPPEGSAVMHLASSLKALAITVPPEKIFYFQISDGSRKVAPDTLLQEAKDQGIGPLYAWSNAWRPLPYMDEVCPRKDGESWGGYLPVLDVCEAVLRTGWRGPWSYEVFYEEDMSKEDKDVPSKWTNAAQESHKFLLKRLKERGF
ncbi:xylose isomerase-like protein [Lentinus tigrinus ALCF2SS1-7]|uniref:Xylose isomerase-like protein n=1 Tax=Lentinus tigrinus ALCF2SS1-6 TaxID=1328759 RepID=A0A5C2SAF7_9APHY|nr:xylose isomerase-like protein [Lentinus tigrinus ALCF2SS1-6]RPD69532.1 xylose isomerase-like protein [Lentinus tigrinus ALCF2SS1-7]